MQKIRNTIIGNARGKKVLLLFILANGVYLLMLMLTIPVTTAYSDGMKLLDMMPLGYSPDYINTLFENLGNTGRQVYMNLQIPVDMIYPFLFGISYCLLIAFLLGKLNKQNTPLFYVCLIPLVAGMADYLENIGILVMLHAYPNQTLTWMTLTNLFTILKSLATTLSFVSLLLILLLLGYRKIRNLNRGGQGRFES